MSTDGASIVVKLLDGTTLPYEDLGDGQEYCIAVGGDEFKIDVTLTGAFLNKHKVANKRLYVTCFIDGVSLGHTRVMSVASYTIGRNCSFKEIWNNDESRSALMFMKLELEEWIDYEDSKANALKFQASKLGMIEVFIESHISMEDTFSNRLRNTQRIHHRQNFVLAPVVKAASASVAPAVSSALATELVAIPVEEVPKAGDTVVKDTKYVLHRRTLTFTEGRQIIRPPPIAIPQPAKKSLTTASRTSLSPTTKPKPKIWVFDEELTVLRISYQTREWFDQAKEKLREEAEAKDNIAAALLDGEVEIVQPQPKRQRGEPVVIDLTEETAIIDEAASQDISSTSHGSSQGKQRCFAKADWLDVWDLIINPGNAKSPQAHTKIIQDLGLTVAEDLEFVDNEIFDALFDVLKPIMARKLNAKFR